MTQAESGNKRVEVFELLYLLSGLFLLILFSPIGGIRTYTQPDELSYAIPLALIGLFQVFALWVARKEKPWGITAMSLLSSIVIPLLLITHIGLILVNYLIVVLNTANLGLLSSDSVTAKLLHRQQVDQNDTCVVVVILHLIVGSFLLILYGIGIMPRVTSLALVSIGLMNTIWIISVILFLSTVLIILRQKFGWLLFFVLDVILLVLGLYSLILSFQSPSSVISQFSHYGNLALQGFQSVSHAAIWCSLIVLVVLVYVMPSMGTSSPASGKTEVDREY
ncbi:MAG: hypothetical protein JW779_13105 [Candidatus Thorarchaeota archaeon]|nr:hypothetical protein [Candidatus Thorarchaeota archaeon]